MHERPEDRLRVVLDRLEVTMASPGVSLGAGLCQTSLAILDVAGAGLSIHSPSSAPFSIGVAGPDMATIHELERTLGEGPCVDAFATCRPASEPDLADPDRARWPVFGREALRTSARAAFGYPLQVGDVSIGALNLYAAVPGELTDEQHENAFVLASVSTQAFLSTFEAGSVDDVDDVAGVGRSQLFVYQATGMVSVQLGVSVDDALAILRARAFAESRPIGELATDVVERRVRFDS